MASTPGLIAGWRKSSYSGSGNNCVEVAQAPASVTVRDSKDQEGPRLVFAPEEWRSFTAAVKAAEFGQD